MLLGDAMSRLWFATLLSILLIGVSIPGAWAEEAPDPTLSMTVHLPSLNPAAKAYIEESIKQATAANRDLTVVQHGNDWEVFAQSHPETDPNIGIIFLSDLARRQAQDRDLQGAIDQYGGKFEKRYPGHAHVKEFLREVYANELGNPKWVAVFKQDPEFEQFIVANHLQQLIPKYGHTIELVPVGRAGEMPVLRAKTKPRGGFNSRTGVEGWIWIKETVPHDSNWVMTGAYYDPKLGIVLGMPEVKEAEAPEKATEVPGEVHEVPGAEVHNADYAKMQGELEAANRAKDEESYVNQELLRQIESLKEASAKDRESLKQMLIQTKEQLINAQNTQGQKSTTLSESQKQVNAMNDRIKYLEEQLKNAQAEKTAALTDVRDLKGQMETVNAKVAEDISAAKVQAETAAKDRDALKQMLAQTKEELLKAQNAQGEKSTALSDAQKQVNAMNDRIKYLEGQLKNTTTTATTETRDLKGQIDAAKVQAETAAKDRDALKQMLAQTKEELLKAQNAQGEKSTALSDAQKQVNAMNDRIKYLEGQLKNTTTTATTETRDLKGQIDAAKVQAETAAKDRDALKQMLAQTKEELLKAQNAQGEKSTALSESQKQVNAMNDRIKYLEGQLKNTTTTATTETRDLKGQIDAAKVQAETAAKDRDALKQMLAQTKEELLKAQNAQGEKSTALSDAQKQVNAMNDRIKYLEGQLKNTTTTATTETRDLKGQIDAAKVQAETAAKDRDALKQMLAQTKEELLKAQNAQGEKSTALSESQKQVNAMNDRIKYLEGQLKNTTTTATTETRDLKGQIDAAKVQAETAAKDRDALKQMLAQTKEELLKAQNAQGEKSTALSDAQKQVNAMNDRIKYLEGQLKNTTTTATTETRDLKGQIDAAKVQAETAAKDRDALKQMLAQTKEELLKAQNAQGEKSTALSESQKQVNAMNDRIKYLEGQLKNTTTTATTETRDLKGQIDAAKVQAEIAAKDRDALKQMLAQTKEELLKAQNAQGEKSTALSDAQKQVNAMNDRIKYLEGQLKNTTTTATTETRDLKGQIDAAKVQAETAAKDRDALKQMLAQTKEELLKAQNAQGEKSTALSDAQKQVNAMNDRIKYLEGQLKNTTTTATTETRDLKGQIDAAKVQAETAAKDRDALKQMLAQTKEELLKAQNAQGEKSTALSDAQKQVNAMNDRIKYLEGQLKNTTTTATTETRDLKGQIDAAKVQAETAAKDRDALKQMLAQTKEELLKAQNAQGEKSTALSDAQKQVNAMNDRIKYLEGQLKNTTTTATTETRDLKGQIDAAKVQAETAAKDRDALKQMLAQTKEELLKAQNAQGEKSTALSESQKQVNAMNDRIKYLEGQLKNTTTTATTETRDLRGQIDAAKVQAETAAKDRDALKQMLAQTKEELLKAQNAQGEKSTALSDAQKQVNAMNDRIKYLEGQLKNTTTTATTETRDLKGQIDAAKVQAETAAKDRDALKQMLAQTKEELLKSQNAQGEKSTALSDAQKQVNAMNDRIKYLEGQLKNATTTVTTETRDLKGQIDAAKVQAETAAKDRDALKQMLAQTKEELLKAQNAQGEKSTALSDAQKQVNAMNDRIKYLEGQLKNTTTTATTETRDLKGQIDAAKVQAETAAKDRDALKQMLAQTKEELLKAQNAQGEKSTALSESQKQVNAMNDRIKYLEGQLKNTTTTATTETRDLKGQIDAAKVQAETAAKDRDALKQMLAQTKEELLKSQNAQGEKSTALSDAQKQVNAMNDRIKYLEGQLKNATTTVTTETRETRDLKGQIDAAKVQAETAAKDRDALKQMLAQTKEELLKSQNAQGEKSTALSDAQKQVNAMNDRIKYLEGQLKNATTTVTTETRETRDLKGQIDAAKVQAETAAKDRDALKQMLAQTKEELLKSQNAQGEKSTALSDAQKQVNAMNDRIKYLEGQLKNATTTVTTETRETRDLKGQIDAAKVQAETAAKDRDALKQMLAQTKEELLKAQNAQGEKSTALSESQKQVNAMNDRIKYLEGQLKNATTTVTTETRETRDLKGQIDAAKVQAETAAKDRDALKQMLAQTKEELLKAQNAQGEKSTALSDAQKQVNAMNDRIKYLEGQLKNTTTTATTETRDLKGQIDAAKVQAETAAKDRDALKQMLAQTKEELLKAQNAQGEKSTALSDAQKQVNAMNDRIKYLEGQLKNTTTTATTETRDLKGQIDAAKVQAETAAKDRDALKQMLAQTKEELLKAQNAQGEKSTALSESQKQVNAMNDRIKYLEGQLKNTTTTATTETRDLKGQIDAAKVQAETAAKDRDALKQMLAQTKEELLKAQNAQGEKSTALSESQKQVNAMNDRIKYLEGQLKNATTTVTTETRETRDLKGQIDAAKVQAETAAKDRDALKQMLAQTKEELLKSQNAQGEKSTALSDAQKQVNAMNDRIKYLEGQLKNTTTTATTETRDLKGQIDAAKVQAETAVKDRDALKQMLAQTKEELLKAQNAQGEKSTALSESQKQVNAMNDRIKYLEGQLKNTTTTATTETRDLKGQIDAAKVQAETAAKDRDALKQMLAQTKEELLKAQNAQGEKSTALSDAQKQVNAMNDRIKYLEGQLKNTTTTATTETRDLKGQIDAAKVQAETAAKDRDALKQMLAQTKEELLKAQNAQGEKSTALSDAQKQVNAMNDRIKYLEGQLKNTTTTATTETRDLKGQIDAAKVQAETAAKDRDALKQMLAQTKEELLKAQNAQGEKSTALSDAQKQVNAMNDRIKYLEGQLKNTTTTATTETRDLKGQIDAAKVQAETAAKDRDALKQMLAQTKEELLKAQNAQGEKSTALSDAQKQVNAMNDRIKYLEGQLKNTTTTATTETRDLKGQIDAAKVQAETAAKDRDALKQMLAQTKEELLKAQNAQGEKSTALSESQKQVNAMNDRIKYLEGQLKNTTTTATTETRDLKGQIDAAKVQAETAAKDRDALKQMLAQTKEELLKAQNAQGEKSTALSDAQKQVNAMNDRIKYLEGQLKNTTTTATTETRDLKGQIDAAKVQAETAAKDRDALKQMLAQTKEELLKAQNAQGEKSTALSESQKQVNAMNDRIKYLEGQLKNTTTTATTETRDLKGQIDAAKVQAETAAKDRDALKQMLAQTKEELLKAQNAQGEKSTALSDAQKQVNAMNDRIKYLEGQLKNTTTTATTETRDLKGQIDAAKVQAETAAKDRDALKQMLAQTKEELLKAQNAQGEKSTALSESQKQVNAMNDRIKYLEGQLKNTTTTATTETRDLKGQIDAAKVQAETAAKDRDALKQMLAQTKEELLKSQNAQGEKSTALSDAQKQVNAMNDRIKYLEGQLKNATTTVTTETRDLKGQIDAAKVQAETAAKDRDALKQMLAQTKEELLKAQNAQGEKSTALSGAQKQVNAMNDRIKYLEGQLKNTTTTATTETRDLKGQIDAAKVQAETAAKDRDALKQMLAQTKEELLKAQNAQGEKSTALSDAQKQVNAMNDRIKYLEGQLKNTTTTATTETRDLKGQIDAAKVQAETAAKDRDALKQMLAQTKEELLKAQNAQGEKSTALSDAQKQVNAMNDRIKYLEGQLKNTTTTATTETRDLKGQIDAAKVQAETAAKDRDALKQMLAQTKEELLKAQNAQGEKSTALSDAQKQVNAMNDRIKYLEGQLKNTTTTATTETRDLKGQIDAAKVQAETAAKDRDALKQMLVQTKEELLKAQNAQGEKSTALSDAQKQVNAMNDRIKYLEGQLKNTTTTATTETRDLKGQIDAAKVQAETAAKDRDALKQMLAQTKEELLKAQNAQGEKSTALSDAQKQVNAMNDRIKYLEGQLKNTTTTATTETRDLKGQIDAAKVQAETAAKDRDALKQMLAQTKEELLKAQNAQGEKSTALSESQKQVNAMNDRIKYLEGQLKNTTTTATTETRDLKGQIDAAKVQAETAAKDRDALKQMLAQTKEELLKAQNGQGEKSTALSEAQKQVNAMNDRIKYLEEQLGRGNDEIKTLTERLKNKEENTIAKITLINESRRVSKENQDLKDQVETAAKDRDALKQMLVQTKEELLKAQNGQGEKSTALSEAQKQVNAMNDRIKYLEEQLKNTTTTATTEIRDLKGQIDLAKAKAREDTSAAKEQVDSAAKDRDALKQMLAQTKEELLKAQNAQGEKSTALSESQKQVNAMNDRIKYLEEQLKNTTTTATTETRDLKGQIDAAKVQAETAAKDRDALKQMLAQTKEELLKAQNAQGEKSTALSESQKQVNAMNDRIKYLEGQVKTTTEATQKSQSDAITELIKKKDREFEIGEKRAVDDAVSRAIAAEQAKAGQLAKSLQNDLDKARAERDQARQAAKDRINQLENQLRTVNLKPATTEQPEKGATGGNGSNKNEEQAKPPAQKTIEEARQDELDRLKEIYAKYPELYPSFLNEMEKYASQNDPQYRYMFNWIYTTTGKVNLVEYLDEKNLVNDYLSLASKVYGLNEGNKPRVEDIKGALNKELDRLGLQYSLRDKWYDQSCQGENCGKRWGEGSTSLYALLVRPYQMVLNIYEADQNKNNNETNKESTTEQKPEEKEQIVAATTKINDDIEARRRKAHKNLIEIENSYPVVKEFWKTNKYHLNYLKVNGKEYLHAPFQHEAYWEALLIEIEKYSPEERQQFIDYARKALQIGDNVELSARGGYGNLQMIRSSLGLDINNKWAGDSCGDESCGIKWGEDRGNVTSLTNLLDHAQAILNALSRARLQGIATQVTESESACTQQSRIVDNIKYLNETYPWVLDFYLSATKNNGKLTNKNFKEKFKEWEPQSTAWYSKLPVINYFTNWYYKRYVFDYELKNWFILATEGYDLNDKTITEFQLSNAVRLWSVRVNGLLRGSNCTNGSNLQEFQNMVLSLYDSSAGSLNLKKD